MFDTAGWHTIENLRSDYTKPSTTALCVLRMESKDRFKSVHYDVGWFSMSDRSWVWNGERLNMCVSKLKKKSKLMWLELPPVKINGTY